jgi:hypothetical protein
MTVPFTFRFGVELLPLPLYPARIPLGGEPPAFRLLPELIVPEADTVIVEFAATVTAAD